MLPNIRFPLEQIRIDFDSALMYGEDQMDICYPVRFPTVTFSLYDFDTLVSLADRARTSNGGRPLYPMEGYPEETCDQNSWYNFYISINDAPSCPVTPYISAYVYGSDCADDGYEYAIPIPKADMSALYESLDDQCRKHLGKSCADLLAEARMEMEEC